MMKYNGTFTVDNAFRNWHKSYSKSKRKLLSNVFPASVSGRGERVEFTFEDEYGKRIVMYINKPKSLTNICILTNQPNTLI